MTEHQCTDSLLQDIEICEHHFENKPLELTSYLSNQCDEILVKVVQPGTTLYLTASEDILINAGHCKKHKAISIELPHVKKETELLVQLFTKASDKKWNKFRQIPVKVYPINTLAPLIKLSQKNSLVVFDESEKLGAFLDKQKVEIVSRYAVLQGTPIGLFVEDENTERSLQDSRLKNAIIFREKVIDLPQIRTITYGKKTHVYVEMKLLDKLDKPLIQKTFLKIIKLAIKPDQTDWRTK